MSGSELLEIPVIPATLVTVVLLEGRGGGVDEGVVFRCGDGEGLRCRLGGRLFDGGLARCFVKLESCSELSTDCKHYNNNV